jgi:transcriptional regulator with XRE-family HTH domain
MMDIGKRLRELRHAKGMSLGAIEKRTGIFKCYVSRVELGYIVPKLPMLEKWAKALRVPLYQLFLVDEAFPHREAVGDLTYTDRRLFELLRRMSEADRRLFYSVAKMIDEGKQA